LACPFFIPLERADDIAFPHPGRLPLGTSWRGSCSVPGHEHTNLSAVELESCNLGYARLCSRIPQQRLCDAVRFGVVEDSVQAIKILFALETEHRPAGNGILQYDLHSGLWTTSHPDDRIQKKAECFLQAYLQKRRVG
jgi:hypothetical protein